MKRGKNTAPFGPEGSESAVQQLLKMPDWLKKYETYCPFGQKEKPQQHAVELLWKMPRVREKSAMTRRRTRKGRCVAIRETGLNFHDRRLRDNLALPFR
jgi:CTP-dependent riboflavin kinase